MPATLECLPDELLLLMCPYLAGFEDGTLAKLCLVSWRLCNIFQGGLYRDIRIPLQRAYCQLEDTTRALKLLKVLEEHPELGKKVSRLHVVLDPEDEKEGELGSDSFHFDLGNIIPLTSLEDSGSDECDQAQLNYVLASVLQHCPNIKELEVFNRQSFVAIAYRTWSIVFSLLELAVKRSPDENRRCKLPQYEMLKKLRINDDMNDEYRSCIDLVWSYPFSDRWGRWDHLSMDQLAVLLRLPALEELHVEGVLDTQLSGGMFRCAPRSSKVRKLALARSRLSTLAIGQLVGLCKELTSFHLAWLCIPGRRPSVPTFTLAATIQALIPHSRTLKELTLDIGSPWRAFYGKLGVVEPAALDPSDYQLPLNALRSFTALKRLNISVEALNFRRHLSLALDDIAQPPLFQSLVDLLPPYLEHLALLGSKLEAWRLIRELDKLGLTAVLEPLDFLRTLDFRGVQVDLQVAEGVEDDWRSFVKLVRVGYGTAVRRLELCMPPGMELKYYLPPEEAGTGPIHRVVPAIEDGRLWTER